MHLFKVNESAIKLNEEMAADFHTFTAKGLFNGK